MDLKSVLVRGRERRRQMLVGPVVDIDQPEIVILTVGPSAFRMVVVLEPMRTDNFGNGREVRGRRGRTGCPFLLSGDRHQMAVIAVSGAVLARREEPFRDEYGPAARQFS
jgi:hypothetical protein